MLRKNKPALAPASDAITAPVDKFCVLSGLGKNTVYQMIGDGRLASIKIGRRRLVVEMSTAVAGEACESGEILRGMEAAAPFVEQTAVIYRGRDLSG